METAKLRIVTADRPPPTIVAQTVPEAAASSPINSVVAVADPVRHIRHLDVDAVLARSLPKVAQKFDKTA